GAVIREGGAPQTEGAARAAAAPAEESAGHFKSAHAPQLVSFRRAPPAGTAPDPASSAPRSYSPAVLAAARAGSVPIDALTAMRGSGRGGRITKADVARFLQAGGASSRAPAPLAPQAGTSEVPAEYRYRPVDADRVVPMSPIRRKIAHHMTWSVRINPRATALAEGDAT